MVEPIWRTNWTMLVPLPMRFGGRSVWATR